MIKLITIIITTAIMHPARTWNIITMVKYQNKYENVLRIHGAVGHTHA